MIIETSLDTLKSLSTFDVCIVGTGAAGMTLAMELDGGPLRVLLIDPGALKPGAATPQDLYEGSTDGAHPDPSHFRRAGYGGSTRIWGGRCVPYDPVDFLRREHVPNSGWPIAHEDIARHHDAAMRYLDAGENAFQASTAIGGGASMFPFRLPSQDIVVDAIERYSLPTDFGKRYHDRLKASKNVFAVGELRALRILPPNAQGLNRLACMLTRSQQGIELQARHIVLATGGIETPRILLNSNVGNEHDLVGRYYTCHVEKIHGVVRCRTPGTIFDFERTRDGVYARRKILFSETAQARERLTNIAFRLHYPDVSQASHRSAVLSAVYLAKRTLIPEYRRILQHSSEETEQVRSMPHLMNVVKGTPELAGFAFKWLTQRVLAERKLPYVLVPNPDNSFPLEFNAEQIPLRDSRVTLSDELDAHGLRKVHVQWRKCDHDVTAIARAYRLLKRELEASGQCTVEFNDARLEQDLEGAFAVGGHHIGTARMGATPQEGVVDVNGEVFGHPGIHVAGSAAFPTSSHANPTLTIVAQSIRLAQHLQSQALQRAA